MASNHSGVSGERAIRPPAGQAVLALAYGGALHRVLPITMSIVVLLAISVFSYRQVIDAYPGGGGAYAVTKDNFGPRASLLAAASVVVDYTLTVAVSIAAGVGALTSAFPNLSSATVPICLASPRAVAVYVAVETDDTDSRIRQLQDQWDQWDQWYRSRCCVPSTHRSPHPGSTTSTSDETPTMSRSSC